MYVATGLQVPRFQRQGGDGRAGEQQGNNKHATINIKKNKICSS